MLPRVCRRMDEVDLWSSRITWITVKLKRDKNEWVWVSALNDQSERGRKVVLMGDMNGREVD